MLRLRARQLAQRDLSLWLQPRNSCLGTGPQPAEGCQLPSRWLFRPPYREVHITALIGEPGFYGRRDVARPGSIELESAAGRWRVILRPGAHPGLPAGRRDANNAGGFSLLEMLIAMAIGAVLMVSVGRFLPLLLEQNLRLQQRVQLQQELQQIAGSLAKALRRAGYCHGQCSGAALTLVSGGSCTAALGRKQ